MTKGKVITCCGDCVYYNMKKHKCKIGYSVENDAKEKFYVDCTTLKDVEDYEKVTYNKAIDDFVELYKSKTTMENKLVDKIAEQLKGAKQNEDFKQEEIQ